MSNELSAKEARQIVTDREVDMTKVFNEIRWASERGASYVRLTHQIKYSDRNVIAKRLVDLGYTIDMKSGYDQIDNEWVTIDVWW